MRAYLSYLWLILAVVGLAGAAQSSTLCGVPVSRVDEAIRFNLYWFGEASTGGYHAGKDISADCLIGQTLVVIGFREIHLVLGWQIADGRSEWVEIQGGYDGAGSADLTQYFVNIEYVISPLSRSVAETWEANRRTVEAMKSGRLPVLPQPRQGVTTSRQKYQLPELVAPASQTKRLLDMKLAQAALELVRTNLRKNMPEGCPCVVFIPYYSSNDPVLFLLTRFKDGQVSVDSFHRNPITGHLQQDYFIYNPNDPAHRFLVWRLVTLAKASEEIK